MLVAAAEGRGFLMPARIAGLNACQLADFEIEKEARFGGPLLSSFSFPILSGPSVI